MQRLTLWTTVLFPIAAIAISLLAWAQPAWFTGGKPAIVPLLVVIMLGMGMTLHWSDFVRVGRQWRAVSCGVGAQYLVMPLAAWVLAKAFGLGPWMTLGVVLVGTCPGGTASNVIAYLARGNVALSITMTLASTLLAVVATPWLTWVYAGQDVPVDVMGLFVEVVKVVVAPVVVGVALNTLLPRVVKKMQPGLPVVSMAAIVAIIGIVVALNAGRLAMMGAAIVAVVVLHNTVGLASGYGAGWLLSRDEATARTISVEVGFQNSGLALALASSVFPDHPEAMLAAALFSVWQNVAGSALAGWWRWSSERRLQGAMA